MYKEFNEYPLTWWDHFKLRWYPSWLLLKYPAKMQRITLKSVCIYDLDKIEMPEYATGVSFNQYMENFERRNK